MRHDRLRGRCCVHPRRGGCLRRTKDEPAAPVGRPASDAAAIAKLGEMFTAAGGKWEQTSIAGHTANTLAKLRADVIAGNAPPAVQLKGPEIAEWNETGMTANSTSSAASEGWDKVVAPELLPVMKPTGNWVAAPMNIHRINWIWVAPRRCRPPA